MHFGEDLLQGKDDGTLAIVKAAEELNVKLQQSFSVTKVFLSMKIVEVKRPLDLMKHLILANFYP